MALLVIGAWGNFYGGNNERRHKRVRRHHALMPSCGLETQTVIFELVRCPKTYRRLLRCSGANFLVSLRFRITRMNSDNSGL